MRNICFLLFIIIYLLSCQKEQKKIVDKDGIKQTQYFNDKGKIYKIDNFEENGVVSTTYLFKDKDSTVYKNDTIISVIETLRERVFVSKNYNNRKQLTSIGTLINQGEGKYIDFVPLDMWLFYNNGKLSNLYYFYMNEDYEILLSQIIYYDKNENKELSKSHYVKIVKENGQLILELNSCCYKGKELLVNGEKVKPISTNKWLIDNKYIIDGNVAGKIILDHSEKYPFLISRQMGNFPKLELSKITYFDEKIE